jgi:hypothetical protein
MVKPSNEFVVRGGGESMDREDGKRWDPGPEWLQAVNSPLLDPEVLNEAESLFGILTLKQKMKVIGSIYEVLAFNERFMKCEPSIVS